jgi:mRNA interferase MazF
MAIRHSYRRGDVVFVPLLYSGLHARKHRPAVVLSTDDYHEEWDELLVVAVTSQGPKSQRATDVALQDWRSAGLSQPSWVRSHLATVDRRIIQGLIGRLSPADLAAVENCLRVATAL